MLIYVIPCVYLFFLLFSVISLLPLVRWEKETYFWSRWLSFYPLQLFQLFVFLSDCTSPQHPKTLQRILDKLNSAVVWMVSLLPFIFNSSFSFLYFRKIILSAWEWLVCLFPSYLTSILMLSPRLDNGRVFRFPLLLLHDLMQWWRRQTDMLISSSL